MGDNATRRSALGNAILLFGYDFCKSCLATEVAATHTEVDLRRLGSSRRRSALLAILIAVARDFQSPGKFCQLTL